MLHFYLQGISLTAFFSSRTRASASSARSMSSALVKRDSEKRTEQWASSGVLPMAISTWVGSGEPDLQADPEESAIPSAADAGADNVTRPPAIRPRPRGCACS